MALPAVPVVEVPILDPKGNDAGFSISVYGLNPRGFFLPDGLALVEQILKRRGFVGYRPWAAGVRERRFEKPSGNGYRRETKEDKDG